MTSNFPDYLSSVRSLVAEVEIERSFENKFSSLVIGDHFGAAFFVGVSSDPVRILRSEACILSDEKSYYFFTFVTKGRGELRHNGRYCALTPMQFGFGDMALPHSASFLRHSRRLLVCVPRADLDVRCADIGKNLGTGIEAASGIGRIATRYFADLFNERNFLDHNGKAAAMEAGIELLLSALRPKKSERGSTELTELSRTAVVLARARSVISANLRDPCLSPALIARLSGISVRYLHRLFETTGESVTSWVRRQRLDRCYADLIDPRLHKTTIIEIAFSWGFNEPSHFSRVFVEQFGMTARDLRQRHQESRESH